MGRLMKDSSQPSPQSRESTPSSCGVQDQPTQEALSARKDPYIPRQVNTVQWEVNARAWKAPECGALTDRGANGSLLGRGVTKLGTTGKTIDLSGVQDHTLATLELGHGATVARSNMGPTIVHVEQGAFVNDGKTILSTIQMESYGCKVVDIPKHLNDGENPYIMSPEGYRFPLACRHGLLYLDIRPVRDDEWDKLPHCYLTSANEWDPKVCDHEVSEEWYEKTAISHSTKEHFDEMVFDPQGNLKTQEEDRDDESDSPKGEYKSNVVYVDDVEAHLTDLVSDELYDSVIEYHVNKAVFHRYVEEEDEQYEWNSWSHQNDDDGWYCFNAEGTRRSTRLRKTVDYSETKKKGDGKKKPNPSRGKTQSVDDEDSGEPSGTVKRYRDAIFDSTQEDGETPDPNDHEPRTDYNNKAKSTDQNEEPVNNIYPIIPTVNGPPTPNDCAVPSLDKNVETWVVVLSPTPAT